MIRHRVYLRGRWYWVQYTWDGRLERHPLRTASRRDAEQLALLHLRKVVAGAVPSATLADAVVAYLNLGRVEKRSWRSDRTLAKAALEHFGAARGLDSIAVADVQDYKAALSKRQGRRGILSHATVNRHLAILRAVYNRAIERGLYSGGNPVARVKMYRESPSLEYFTADEVARILAAAGEVSAGATSTIQRYFLPIVATAISTGMRLGEILRLRWADIKDGVITVTAESAKSKRARQVPARPELLQALSRLPSTAGEYVFPVRRDSGVIRPTWRKVKRLAGIRPAARFHSLRHSFGTALVRRGVDLVTVKELLGHSSLAMTEIYTHSSQGAKKAAIGALDFVQIKTSKSAQVPASKKALKR